jgi:hypothetical protein
MPRVTAFKRESKFDTLLPRYGRFDIRRPPLDLRPSTDSEKKLGDAVQTARLLVIGTVTTLAIGLGAAPAAAAPTAETDVTFEIVAGDLDITAPTGPVNLGAFTAPGTADGGQLGPVAVADGRAAPDATWDATVTSTDYTTGDASSPDEIIEAALVSYWSGPATVAGAGTGTFDDGQTAAGNAAALNTVTELPAFAHDGGTGNNSVTWNPTIIVNTPLDSVAGDYAGTVTHSVA